MFVETQTAAAHITRKKVMAEFWGYKHSTFLQEKSIIFQDEKSAFLRPCTWHVARITDVLLMITVFPSVSPTALRLIGSIILYCDAQAQFHERGRGP